MVVCQLSGTPPWRGVTLNLQFTTMWHVGRSIYQMVWQVCAADFVWCCRTLTVFLSLYSKSVNLCIYLNNLKTIHLYPSKQCLHFNFLFVSDSLFWLRAYIKIIQVICCKCLNHTINQKTNKKLCFTIILTIVIKPA